MTSTAAPRLTQTAPASGTSLIAIYFRDCYFDDRHSGPLILRLLLQLLLRLLPLVLLLLPLRRLPLILGRQATHPDDTRVVDFIDINGPLSGLSPRSPALCPTLTRNRRQSSFDIVDCPLQPSPLSVP